MSVPVYRCCYANYNHAHNIAGQGPAMSSWSCQVTASQRGCYISNLRFFEGSKQSISSAAVKPETNQTCRSQKQISYQIGWGPRLTPTATRALDKEGSNGNVATVNQKTRRGNHVGRQKKKRKRYAPDRRRMKVSHNKTEYMCVMKGRQVEQGYSEQRWKRSKS